MLKELKFQLRVGSSAQMFSCKILDSHFSLLHFNDLVQFHSQILRDYKKHVFNIKNLFTTMGAIAH